MPIQNLISRLQDFDEKQSFFVVGSAKSGTTRLMRCLDGHDDIFCSGEDMSDRIINEIPKLVEAYNKETVTALPNQTGVATPFLYTQQSFEELCAFVLYQQFISHPANPDAKFLGSKQPDLLRIIDPVAAFLPEAKFLHIIRDGRDVLVSAWHHNLQAKTPGFETTPPDLGAFVRANLDTWKRAVEIYRDFGRKHPDRYKEVRYEGLLEAPEQTLAEVLDFIGAESDPEHLQSCVAHGDFKRMSGRARGTEDRTSFFRKGVAGDWSKHFDEKTIAAIKASDAGALLEELGYTGW
ncbi:MAG: sulfotransferase [Rhodospirillales bacterium]|nr:sulfotransferase [Rhodospirillales bacterium]MBO6787132.1 sulfotransferase [Rhodospirillales bacterium]